MSNSRACPLFFKLAEVKGRRICRTKLNTRERAFLNLLEKKAKEAGVDVDQLMRRVT